eukprot:Skav222541  [mRNA]  locus=scaffold2875:252057:255443:+ [translate_table: standard]
MCSSFIWQKVLEEEIQENKRPEVSPAAAAAVDEPVVIADNSPEPAQEHEWTLEDAIDFCNHFESKEEVLKSKPEIIDENVWEEILMVFPLVKAHGKDPNVIQEKLQAMVNNGETNEPRPKEAAETEIDQDTPEENEDSKPETKPKPDDVEKKQRIRMCYTDALVLMKDCGFDEATSRQCLADAQDDVAEAIRLATQSNLTARAAAGEFGDPATAMEEVQTVLVDTDCLPPQDSQYGAQFEEMTMREFRQYVPDKSANLNNIVDNMATLNLDDNGNEDPLLRQKTLRLGETETPEKDKEVSSADDSAMIKPKVEPVDKETEKAEDIKDNKPSNRKTVKGEDIQDNKPSNREKVKVAGIKPSKKETVKGDDIQDIKTSNEKVKVVDIKPSNKETVKGDDITPSNKETVKAVDSKPSNKETVKGDDITPSNKETVKAVDSKPSNKETVKAVDSKPSSKETVKGDDITPSNKETVKAVDSKPSNKETVKMRRMDTIKTTKSGDTETTMTTMVIDDDETEPKLEENGENCEASRPKKKLRRSKVLSPADPTTTSCPELNMLKSVEASLDEAIPPAYSEQGMPKGRKPKAKPAPEHNAGASKVSITKRKSKRKLRTLKSGTAEDKPNAPAPAASEPAKRKRAPKASPKAKPAAKRASRSKRRSNKTMTENTMEPTAEPTAEPTTGPSTEPSTESPAEPTPRSMEAAIDTEQTEIPKDAQDAPDHVTTNGVYSTAYKRVKQAGGSTDDARAAGQRASNLLRDHGKVSPSLSGVPRVRKNKTKADP